jgi:aspartate/tyrosine/aromatic aminotransferase
MKKIALIAITLLVLASCNKVEQEVRKVNSIVAPSGTALVTYVWYDDNIITAWYDDIYKVNDSLIKVRQEQGKALLKTISHIK